MADFLTDNTGQVVQPGIDMQPRDVARKLVDGDLAADGVQWSAEGSIGAENVYTVMFTKTISEVKPGTLLEVEFGLTAAFKADSSPTADLTWKWQAKKSSATAWVDLHPEVSEANIGLTYVERTRTGFTTIVSDFDGLPFDIRLLLKSNENSQGKAKVKNSSYVRFMYKPS